MTLKFLSIFSLIILSPVIFLDVFAEESILISLSSDLDQVIFDGKWTTVSEWKKSSYNHIKFNDGAEIHLRTAHQENFLYIQINSASDMIINKGSDSAIVCFDTKNDKTKISQFDDYCFSTSLGSNNYFTYQGGNISAVNGNFKKITNDKDFVAIGTTTDKVDRYNKTPHVSYEFRIPLDVIGRSDNYGFYISVFDAHSQNNYSWPYNIEKKSLLTIPSPSQWGDLVSPDKSLPEFNFTVLSFILIPLIMLSIVISKSNLFKLNSL